MSHAAQEVSTAVASDPDLAHASPVAGSLKRFDESNGYGFIVPDDGGGDVYVSLQCFLCAGYPEIERGARITCEVRLTRKGRYATRVLSVEKPVASPWKNAVVKWYNPHRRHGFLQVEGEPDVLIHGKVLEKCGVRILRKGQRVTVRCLTAPNGPYASDVQISGE